MEHRKSWDKILHTYTSLQCPARWQFWSGQEIVRTSRSRLYGWSVPWNRYWWSESDCRLPAQEFQNDFLIQIHEAGIPSDPTVHDSKFYFPLHEATVRPEKLRNQLADWCIARFLKVRRWIVNEMLTFVNHRVPVGPDVLWNELSFQQKRGIYCGKSICCVSARNGQWIGKQLWRRRGIDLAHREIRTNCKTDSHQYRGVLTGKRDTPWGLRLTFCALVGLFHRFPDA